MTNQELPEQDYAALWQDLRAERDELSRELAAARALLEAQARMIDGLTKEQEQLRGNRLYDAQMVAGAHADLAAALNVAEDSAAECKLLRAHNEHLTVQLTQARAANARLQSQLEPARLRAWALYERQTKEAHE